MIANRIKQGGKWMGAGSTLIHTSFTGGAPGWPVPAKLTKLIQAQLSFWITAEVEGWIQPPGWLQQPGNVWMDLTERLEGLGPGPLPQDRECLIIFEVSVSQAHSPEVSNLQLPLEILTCSQAFQRYCSAWAGLGNLLCGADTGASIDHNVGRESVMLWCEQLGSPGCD